jgi:hypothetical protein
VVCLCADNGYHKTAICVVTRPEKNWPLVRAGQ